MAAGTGDPVWRTDSGFGRVAVIAALELESRILKAGRLPSFAVVVSGPGRESAAQAARQAIADGAQSLIAWGLAGGLQTSIANGTIALPHSVISDEGTWQVDAHWRQRLQDALFGQLPIADGPLFTADRVLTSPDDKAALAQRTGAVAVDMESAAVAEVATSAGIPFVVVRAIADAADDALPDGIDRLITVDGKTAWRELPSMLMSWRRLALLLRLSGLSRRARSSLHQLLLALQEPPG